MTATVGFAWDCGHGCPPIHLQVPVTLHPVSADPTGVLVTAVVTVDSDHRLEQAVAAHMAGVHS